MSDLSYKSDMKRARKTLRGQKRNRISVRLHSDTFGALRERERRHGVPIGRQVSDILDDVTNHVTYVFRGYTGRA